MTEVYHYIHRHKEPWVDVIADIFILGPWLSQNSICHELWRDDLEHSHLQPVAPPDLTLWLVKLHESTATRASLQGLRGLEDSRFSFERLSYLRDLKNIVLRTRTNPSLLWIFIKVRMRIRACKISRFGIIHPRTLPVLIGLADFYKNLMIAVFSDNVRLTNNKSSDIRNKTV